MGQNAPAEAADVFADINPPPTVYVTNPQATGWGAEWNGAPVVRPPLYADAIYQAGELVATTGHVAQAIASQLPGIVYSNSVSALTIYTNASGAATSWWQVASGVTNSGSFASGTPGAITNGQTGGVIIESPMIVHTRTGIGLIVNGSPNTWTDELNTQGAMIGLTWNADNNNQLFFGRAFKSGNDWVGGIGVRFVGTGIDGFNMGTGTAVPLAVGNQWGDQAVNIWGWPTHIRGQLYCYDDAFIGKSLTVAKTNTAAVVRSTGGYIIGPTISGKQAHIFTDGTNCFFVNVNSVTNALTTN